MMVEGTKSEWSASGFLGLDIAVNDDEQMILGAPIATVDKTLVNISGYNRNYLWQTKIMFLLKRMPDISVR